MTEALTAVMQFLFTEVGMNRIEAKHDINNPILVVSCKSAA